MLVAAESGAVTAIEKDGVRVATEPAAAIPLFGQLKQRMGIAEVTTANYRITLPESHLLQVAANGKNCGRVG